MCQSQQKTQASNIPVQEIRININLPYVECTKEKLRHILRSYKITFTFHTESTLRKLLCKPKDRVATEDKNNIVYGIDCSNCEAVYFDEYKRSLKSRSDERKRPVRNCDCEKNEIARHCWEAEHNFSWGQKNIVDRESRLTPRKIKETIHPMKNLNHIKRLPKTLSDCLLVNDYTFSNGLYRLRKKHITIKESTNFFPNFSTTLEDIEEACICRDVPFTNLKIFIKAEVLQ